MPRLNDTEAIRFRPLKDNVNMLEAPDSSHARCDPDAGAARTAFWGQRPNGPKNPNAGSEGLRGAVMKLNGGEVPRGRR